MFWSIRQPNFSMPCSSDLQRPEPASGLQAVVVKPIGRCEAARRRLQIFRRDRECAAMRSGIPDQDAAGFERCVQPFMWIERHGIGTLDSGDAICILGGDGHERADAAVDMEPEILFCRQFCETLQIVDCPSVHRPGGSYNAGRLQSRRTILRDRRPQGGRSIRSVASVGMRRRARFPSPSASIALRWQL